NRIVLVAEEAFSIIGWRIELSTNIHTTGDKFYCSLPTFELGKSRRIIMHGIDTAGIRSDGIAQGHGLRVANGQVLRKLSLTLHCPEQRHPGNRSRERRNSLTHE